MGIRDAWYGYSASATTDEAPPAMEHAQEVLRRRVPGPGVSDLGPPESGILADAVLFVGTGLRRHDVFSSRRWRTELALEVTLDNPTEPAHRGRAHLRGGRRRGQSSRAFAAALPPDAGENSSVSSPSPGRPPALVARRTAALSPCGPPCSRADGRTLDSLRPPFGFREWTMAGKDFPLERLSPGTAGPTSTTTPTGEKWLDFYRQTHQTFMRLWGTHGGPDARQTLDFFDKSGVLVRRSGMLDGEAIGYMAIENDPALKKQYGSEIKMELMEDWRDQMIAQVKGERNHPSIRYGRSKMNGCISTASIFMDV